MKKEKVLNDLADSIVMEAHIECSKCGEVSEVYDRDDYEAAMELHGMGWYATSQNTYCPKCNKKRKKKNK